MAFCTSCGNPADPNAKFCANCGQPAAASTPPPPESTASMVLPPPPSPPPSATPPRKNNIGTIILTAVLALAVIFGGFAAWMWMDNSGQVKDLNAANDSLITEKADLSSQVSNLSSQIQTLNTDKSKLEADKTKLAADLAALQKKYPLKNFATEFELQNWLLNAIKKLNPLDDYPAQYYMLQRLAMEDGYFLSVAIWEDETYFYPELYAVAGDVVYLCYEDGSMYVSFILP